MWLKLYQLTVATRVSHTDQNLSQAAVSALDSLETETTCFKFFIYLASYQNTMTQGKSTKNGSLVVHVPHPAWKHNYACMLVSPPQLTHRKLMHILYGSSQHIQDSLTNLTHSVALPTTHMLVTAKSLFLSITSSHLTPTSSHLWDSYASLSHGPFGLPTPKTIHIPSSHLLVFPLVCTFSLNRTTMHRVTQAKKQGVASSNPPSCPSRHP